MASASAETLRFYLGTENYHTPSPGIYLGAFDTATGKLGPVTLAGATPNPGFLALAANNRVLYATKNPLKAENEISAFSIQPDGSLRLINEQSSGGLGICHISLSHDGRYLFAANYGGNIACLPIHADGSLEAKTGEQKYTGSGPNIKRQESAHTHSVFSDPSDHFVYACDLGSDRIWISKLDAASGALTPNNPACVELPPGSGPRHLAFHPGGRFIYAINELGITTTCLTRDTTTGALTPFATVSNLPPGASTKGMTSSAIFCHPSGKWLYTSDRGPDDSLSVFAIADNGTLKLVQHLSSVVKMPRAFALDPSGQWLIAAGQKDGRLAVFRIDPKSGQLTLVDQGPAAPDLTCVQFISR